MMDNNIGVIHEVGDFGVDFGYKELTPEEKKQIEKENDDRKKK